ncbi:uncharacterized protein [Engystomops pustulosus]|uniref:uncharacterized protein n=1 Tax=Engystomops pustulosus TaxID=76066 RepID=UPI003AFA226C
MESASRILNRTPLTCPVCCRPDKILSTHLKRKCMRLNTEQERKAALKLARKQLMSIAAKGTAIYYPDIMSLGSLENVVPFLEDRGFVIISKPTPSRQGTSSTSVPAATSTVPQPEPEQPSEPDMEDVPALMEMDDQEEPGDDHDQRDQEGPGDDHDQRDQEGPGDDHDQRDQEGPGDDHDQRDQEPSRREEEESEDDLPMYSHTQRHLQTNWTSDVRLRMKAAGLYRRHSLDHPILKGFASYLADTLNVTNYSQEVEDVSRFLFFMNPKAVNLEFVKDVQKANAFFTKLRELNLANQTVFNYLKHVRRFMTYQLRATNLFSEHPRLYKSCEFFKDVTEDIQKRLSKGISKEVVSKRYQALITTTKSPDDCRRLLSVAKPSFLQSIGAVQAGSCDMSSQLDIIYYLETLLVLKHLQRPGVVANMTVSEWRDRISHTYRGEELVIIGVKTHKTATQQVATFVLNKEEEKWFECYFEKVRPKLILRKSTNDSFFVSTSGKAIHNVSNDIRRYHQKFELPSITSQLVRRVCETWTMPNYSDSEKCLFAKYLAHTNLTAERNYREKTLEDICHAYSLVVQAGQGASDQPRPSTSRITDEEEQEEHNEDDQTMQLDGDSPIGVTTRSQKRRQPETRGSSSSRRYMDVEDQDSEDEDGPFPQEEDVREERMDLSTRESELEAGGSSSSSNLDVEDLRKSDEEGGEDMIGVVTRNQKRRQPEEEGGSSIRDFNAEENQASQQEDDWILQLIGSTTEESLSDSDDAEFTSRAQTSSLPTVSTRSQRKTEPAADRSTRTEEPRRSSRLRR